MRGRASSCRTPTRRRDRASRRDRSSATRRPPQSSTCGRRQRRSASPGSALRAPTRRGAARASSRSGSTDAWSAAGAGRGTRVQPDLLQRDEKACRVVSRLDLVERWVDLRQSSNALGHRATKGQASGRASRPERSAADRGETAWTFLVDPRNGIDQRPGVGMARLHQHAPRASGLRDSGPRT